MNDDSRLDILSMIMQDINTVPTPEPEAASQQDVPYREESDIIELGEDFDFGDFQVVRREFFAHVHEPSATFNTCKFYVNAACISKFPDVDYVQVLVNKETRIMALRPCSSDTRDSFAWCYISKGKRKPKAITCKLFFAKVVEMMGWNPNYRYKLLGRTIHANDEYLIAFDLTATEVYQRTIEEGKKPKNSKVPVFPAGWQEQFGLPFNEHKQTMQISTFDGYAIYSITNGSAENSEDLSSVNALPESRR